MSLRDYYNKPIYIASGYRCQILNNLINGSENSQHMEGKAVDIDTLEDNVLLFEYIKDKLIFDQLIWEFGDDYMPAWIHVSYNQPYNRKQILRAILREGKIAYERYRY